MHLFLSFLWNYSFAKYQMFPRNWQKHPPEVFYKKSYSEIFRKIHWKTPICEISKNTFFTKHLRTAATELNFKS